MTPLVPEAQAWLEAARDPRTAARLESIYNEVAQAIAERAPACWASGRCCNFERLGHRLYVTGLETAYAVSRLERGTHPELSILSLTQARTRGGCPFQVKNVCGIHRIKPLSCRVYFCDRSAQQWQKELSERMHAAIKALHDEEGIEYRYAEWRSLLDLFTS
jgi:Fe-S-cluster containining protein